MSHKNGEQQREPRKGVFDSNLKAPIELEKGTPAAEPAAPPPQKENMEDVFVQQDAQVKSRAHKAGQLGDTKAEEDVNKINKSLSSVDQDLEDIPITDEDMKLAEKLIFDGYAQTDIVMDSFPDRKFTICSTNAEEIGIIDEVVFDLMKKHETDDGMIDIPQNKIQTLRNAIFVALGYIGRDGTDLCGVDKSRNLIVIKKGIVRRGDLESAGKTEDAEKITKSLIAAILVRARRVQQMPTQMIDFLSGEKYKFDKKMLKIMTTKGVVPKS